MDPTEDQMLEAIRNIQEGRRSLHLYPDIATLYDVCLALSCWDAKRMVGLMEKLSRDGRIAYGRTINGYYLSIIQ